MHRVVYAMDGEEGLMVFENEKPDLVLLDIAMPKKDGFEVLEEIRKDLQSDVLVVIFSNSKDQEMVERANSLGVSDYLLKGNTAHASLVTTINELLENQAE